MAILIGDMRQQMGENLCKVIDGVINRNSDKKQYYILVHSKFNSDNVIKQSIVLTSTIPDKMFGTICFHVDNQKGEVKRIWILPLDVPAVGHVDDVKGVNMDIIKSLDGVAGDLVY